MSFLSSVGKILSAIDGDGGPSNSQQEGCSFMGGQHETPYSQRRYVDSDGHQSVNPDDNRVDMNVDWLFSD